MNADIIQLPFGADTPVGVVLEHLGFSMERMIELAALNQQLQQEVSGSEPEVIPIKEVIAGFMEEWFTDTGHHHKLAETSIETYQPITIMLQEYLLANGGWALNSKQIYEHCSTFVQKIATERGLALATRNKYAALVRRFCWFVYENYLSRKPILPEIGNSKELLPQSLSDQEVAQLVFASRQGQYGIRSHFFVQFLLATGLRRDEFRHAKLKDIQISDSGPYIKVTHGKGGTQRDVPFPEGILPLLAEYCQVYSITRPDDHLYCHPKYPGKQLGNAALSKQFQTIAQRMPSYHASDRVYRFHLHTLRHTYAKNMVIAGVPIRVIADLLGHKRVSTTQIYTKLDVPAMREAAQPGLTKIGEIITGRLKDAKIKSTS